MTSRIVTVCEEFERSLQSNNPEHVMSNCIRNKLLNIYQQNNKEFDTLLMKLEGGVNYNDASQVKKCVTSLLRLLNSNTKSLISVLGKVL